MQQQHVMRDKNNVICTKIATKYNSAWHFECLIKITLTKLPLYNLHKLHKYVYVTMI